jgi:hypothetical protein
MRAATAITLALAAIAVGACGSSKKSTSSQASVSSATTVSPPSTSTGTSTGKALPITQLDPVFIEGVNAICTQANKEISSKHGPFPYSNFDPLHPDRRLLPKVAAYFSGVRAIADRVPVQLGELAYPTKGAILWRTLVRLAREERAIADRQIRAAEASDVAAFVKTVREVRSTNNKIGRLAVLGGFGTSSPCTQLL